MEEKKLTDEEIAKAILQQVEYGAGIPYIDEWGKVRTIKFTEILDFIHRLQSEKYQVEQNLAQCENGYEQELHIERHKVGELQKQVDDLKKENERLKKFEMYRIKAMKEDKEEIERLTADLISMDREQEGYIATIKDLNKQIDEFVKIARFTDTKKLVCDIKEQAVKDTAKDIYELAVKHYNEDELGFFEELKNRYGIEVDL